MKSRSPAKSKSRGPHRQLRSAKPPTAPASAACVAPPVALNSDEFVALARREAAVAGRVLEACYRDFLSSESGFVAIDGGAYNGYNVDRLASIEGCRAVVAVEAAPAAAERLRALGAPKFGEIVVVEAAIQADSSVDTSPYQLSSSHPSYSGIRPIWDYLPEIIYSTQEVAATTIDKVVADAKDAVQFINLDLEGGEFAALRGATATLTAGRPIVAMDNSIHAARVGGFTRADFYNFLQKSGYVPLTFWGEAMNLDNEFAFWYAWAVPEEKADVLSRIAASHVAEAMRG